MSEPGRQTPRAMRFRWVQRLAMLGAAGALLLGIAALIERHLEASARAWLSQNETFAQLDGHRVRYRLEGAARPGATLVLLNGFGSAVEEWDELLARLGPIAPVLRYDRQGLGLSEGPAAHDADAALRELEAVLRLPGVRPPFVLVSYSASGLLAEAFAKRHPEQLAGMVFLDPVIPEQQAAQDSPEERLRARGIQHGMIKNLLQVVFGVARARAFFARGAKASSRGDEIVQLTLHWVATFAEVKVNGELARLALGFTAPRVPVALLSTRELEPAPELRETYALQHKLADSSGQPIFRDLHDQDHGRLLRDPRGIDASAALIRAEVDAVSKR